MQHRRPAGGRRRAWRCRSEPLPAMPPTELESAASRRANDRRAETRRRDARLPRRRARAGELRRVPGARRGRAWSCSTRPPDPGDRRPRPRGALELQGGQVRLVQRRGQRQAAADVHDADGHLPAGRADHRRADEDVPAHQGPGHRRVVELRGHQDRSRRSGRGRRTPTAPTG